MSIETLDDGTVDIARQALDDAQWHRATNEGWRHPPEPPTAGAVPPETLAPRVAVAVPGRVVQMAAWRERRPAKRRARGTAAS